jgi:methionyl-tRNA synthetase
MHGDIYTPSRMRSEAADVQDAEREAAGACRNCGERACGDPCGACGWPQQDESKDAPLCSVCRRRHGKEIIHECE